MYRIKLKQCQLKVSNRSVALVNLDDSVSSGYTIGGLSSSAQFHIVS
jgi:hypothetical protein